MEKMVQRDKASSPATIICDLCRQFYDANWVTGTAGGISILQGNQIYIAPSGVQKERMQPEDLFIMDMVTGKYLYEPREFKPSACTPLFLSAFTVRGAAACIHTHSQNAVLVSLLYDKKFCMSNFENIKAVPHVTRPGRLSFFDTLVVPIIENVAHEEQLTPFLHAAMLQYPETSAVIVRRHGIYVWGDDIWQAKILNEALDYLMELAVKMRQLGLDPCASYKTYSGFNPGDKQ